MNNINYDIDIINKLRTKRQYQMMYNDPVGNGIMDIINEKVGFKGYEVIDFWICADGSGDA
jgi:hypothetical protein